MEKTIAVQGVDYHFDSEVEKVNKFLEQGWTVKTLKLAMSSEKECTHCMAVYVLEKADEEAH